MEVRVSGHGVDTGTAFRAYASGRLIAVWQKFFSHKASAQVTLSPAPHSSFSCEIFMPLGRNGLVAKASGHNQDPHAAFDQASVRIEKQLRRYHRRLKDHQSLTSQIEVERFDANYTIFHAHTEDEEAKDDAPLVIAENRSDVPEDSVSDAVMMLDLRNTGALLFVNSKTGLHNRVYRREDGNIGWVEPQAVSKTAE